MSDPNSSSAAWGGSGVGVGEAIAVPAPGLDVALTQGVQEVAPQLAHRLTQAVHVSRGHHAEVLRPGQRTPGDEGQRRGRFGVLLLRVVDEAGVEDVAVLREAGLGLLEV